MATFDQLSAEQRAIIELVLKQGQSYEQLGEMLGLPTPRIRDLARQALVRLSPVSAATVADDWRGQLGDYLLNQQVGPEATATRGHLRRSEAARGWARSVLDSLEQFYDEKNLPAIPEGEAAAEPEPRRDREERPAPTPRRRELSPAAQEIVRRRRLIGGGAAALALLLVLLVLPGVGPFDLTGGDDGEGDQAAGAPDSSQQARLVGQLALQPVEGAPKEAQGIAAIAERGGATSLIVQAQLPRTERGQAYEVWLYNSDGDAYSMGAQVTDQQGDFQGAGTLPEDFERFRFIDISREMIPRTEAQTRSERGHSGTSMLRGELDQLAPVPENVGQGAAPGGAAPGGGQGDAPAPAPQQP